MTSGGKGYRRFSSTGGFMQVGLEGSAIGNLQSQAVVQAGQTSFNF